MARLIDADIMKQAIIATMEKNNTYVDHVVCNFALKMLAAVKTEDAVKVVRCKNCRNCRIYATSGNLYCTHQNGIMEPKPNDFCSYGVKEKQ